MLRRWKREKKRYSSRWLPAFKDTFGIEVFSPNNDTLFQQSWVGWSLENTFRKNGSFSYCFYVDGCSGINEPVERLPPEEEQKIKKNLREYKTRMRKRYGQPVKFYFNVPYNVKK